MQEPAIHMQKSMVIECLINRMVKGGDANGTKKGTYGRRCKQVRTLGAGSTSDAFFRTQPCLFLSKGAETVYVRLTDESHKPYAKIAGEVQWVEFLGSNGVCVARPHYSAAGNLAERIRMEDHDYTAVCYEEAKGRPVGENDADESLHRRMGQFMGRMHGITKGYIHLDPVTKRPDWSEEAGKVRRIALPPSEKEITLGYQALLHYISEFRLLRTLMD